MNPSAEPPLPDLTAAQAARALGVARSTVLRRAYDGTIPYGQIGRRGRLRFRAADLRRLGVPRAAIEAAYDAAAVRRARGES